MELTRADLDRVLLVVRMLLLLGAGGCNYSIMKVQPAEVPRASLYKPSELSFSAVYSKVLRTNCTGCHGTSGGVNLETYQEVKRHLNAIVQSTITTRQMPKLPNMPLDSAQLGLLNAWIQAGAPETAGSDEVPLPTLEPTYASIRAVILEPKCLMCHAPGKPTARVPLVTWKDLLESPLDIVIPGNAAESGLILSVTHEDPDKLMPPPRDKEGKPTGYSPLSAREIQVLMDWINRGAPSE